MSAPSNLTVPFHPASTQPPTMQAIIAATTVHVRAYMTAYDSSHSFAHTRRVLALSHRLVALEQQQQHHHLSSQPLYDTPLITLSALLHDVGDSKYLAPGADGSTQAHDFLVHSAGAPAALAAKVQRIVNAVSYSAEVRDPARVAAVLAEAPELGVVQDADRLDALGAVGVGRCFTYSAAREAREGKGTGQRSMEDAVVHFGEKLERLEGMMKTDAGREMARVRTERLRVFRGWWEEECAIVAELGDDFAELQGNGDVRM